ncbi:MAG: glycosyltransferase family 4 protein [Mariprofundaceae bacterium]|nr:glycosyltransferase family 4 protein [Mariprofundaceae bacterium]
MPKPLIIVQICRRFGPVGGMERYVWELCRELAIMGHHVHVLCEVNLCTEPLSNVSIHELGEIRPKPRWLAHIRFSCHVHQWLEKNRTSEMIIHSHERTADHQITTFHGPPFAKVRDLPCWKRFSPRITMNLWLEQRELCAAQVQMIVPNSKQIAENIEYYYPSISHRITPPIVPGVADVPKRPMRAIAPDGGMIGFIGKEWKRKGLVMAIDIMNELVKQRPNLHFMVAGSMQKDIQSLFKSATFQFSLLGEVDTKDFYPQLDVLLHPANNEPYGMVITEALAAGVPVVISDVCGAASEINAKLGSVLALESSVTLWCNALELWLNLSDANIDYQRSWYHTALSYEALYKKIELSSKDF